VLALKKLFHKNLLSLQNKKGLKLAGFPNKNVSDEFVKVVMKLSKGHKLVPEDLTYLKIGEKELLDNLLHVSGLHKTIITGSGSHSLEKVKKELEIVEGEIEAGNNNPIIKKKLYDVLFKLVHFGALTESQARKHYKQVITEFF
jgi:hypothetical protein